MTPLQQAAERLVKADAEWHLLDSLVRDATERRETARIKDQDAANAFGVACGLAAPQGGTDIGRAVTIARAVLDALREVQADTVARIIPAATPNSFTPQLRETPTTKPPPPTPSPYADYVQEE